MSNTIAEGATVPVDALAWLLRKGGLNIPQNPIGGSDWAAQQGLTRQVPQGAPKVAGEAFGLLAPMAATKQGASKIAGGLLDMGENLAKPAMLNKQAGAFKFPQDEALAIAQRNAAKPISEGGLGLAANNTPMDRAKAMGFDDKTWYHGTNADIKKFDPKKSAQGGITWIAENPQYSAEYASKIGGNVIPLKANLGNQAGWKEYDKFGIDELASRGYNSTYLPDAEESVAFVMNPQQLRSRFAAFDPARKNEADLLGRADPRLLALLAAGVGGAAYGSKDK
jgi:hypothetical protein